MTHQLTYALSDLDSSHVAVAGGKGSSLGELMQAAVPVPPGFVVASAAFERFIRAGDHLRYVNELVHELDLGRIEASQTAAEIARLLGRVRVPDEVASTVEEAVAELGARRVSVRSSATCEDSGTSAWAGQLETYLDVSSEHIVDRIRDCWMSMFSPSALTYGAAHGYGAGQFAVAVVVQQMVASDVSGIGFSVHPVTQEPNIQLVEACLGLGEAIVSGRIVPDQYVVERGSDTIFECTVGAQREGLFVEKDESNAVWRELDDRGSKRKLNDPQVIEYAKLLSRIQDHYGHPVDTEWALEDGLFQVLQARPITTLAEEYRESVIEAADEWQPVVRRPQSLIEVSISTHWFDSRHAEKSLGVYVDRALAIQDDAGMANLFFARQAMDACLQRVVDLFQHDRARLIQILKQGHALYRDTEARIEQGAEGFRTLDDAADFFADVAQHTTVFPHWVLIVCERDGIEDPEVRSLAEELRARTLYPSIERRIIDPMVISVTKALGFSAPEEAPHVVTWSELRRGALDRDTLESRLEDARAGRRFVFQTIDGDDQVRFVSQTGYLLMRLAKQRQIVQRSDDNQLYGQAAWPGIYQGRARVVLSPDAVGQTFEEGEVLVSIQSSPALMPLLRRCGAIVTDDGGIACHAAIIARELRKPTLIGTKSATSTIHTGDVVEVGTYAQVVRIIQRAGAK
jgi:pyruvate, water dikinase